jgi:ABC-type antimicrobial peptide transport system permease subunit
MGILSVVVLQTIGEGAQKQISSRLSSFGTNTITISAARSSNDVRIENIVDSSTFINDDMIRLLKKITTISYISPTQSLNSVVNV